MKRVLFSRKPLCNVFRVSPFAVQMLRLLIKSSTKQCFFFFFCKNKNETKQVPSVVSSLM